MKDLVLPTPNKLYYLSEEVDRLYVSRPVSMACVVERITSIDGDKFYPKYFVEFVGDKQIRVIDPFSGKSDVYGDYQIRFRDWSGVRRQESLYAPLLAAAKVVEDKLVIDSLHRKMTEKESRHTGVTQTQWRVYIDGEYRGSKKSLDRAKWLFREWAEPDSQNCMISTGQMGERSYYVPTHNGKHFVWGKVKTDTES